MKFSILIPAYNVEKYVRRCLDSIVNQTFNDFEVIIIDDGSTDNTLAICNEYTKRDKRFNVYHQTNSGVACTRNVALEKAQGEWIVFVDADDYIDLHYLECFNKSIISDESVDVWVCGYYVLTNSNMIAKQQQFTSKQDYLERMIEQRNIATTLWAKVIKHDFILTNNIRFHNEINMGEDICFMSILFYNAKKIEYIPKYLYYWEHTNINSMTFNSSLYTNDMIKYHLYIMDFYKRKLDYCLYEKAINKSLFKLKQKVYLLSRKKTKIKELDYSSLNKIDRLKNFIIEKNFYKLLRIFVKIEFYVAKFIKIDKKI